MQCFFNKNINKHISLSSLWPLAGCADRIVHPVRVTCEGVGAMGSSPCSLEVWEVNDSRHTQWGTDSESVWGLFHERGKLSLCALSVSESERVCVFASSCYSDKLLTAPATSTSATKVSWEGGHDRRAGLPYVSCLILQSDSANTCQSLSTQDRSYSTAGVCWRFGGWLH